MANLITSDVAWMFLAAMAGVLVLGCLRIIGYEYYNAVLWHNLKVQVHNMRIDQQRRLDSMDHPSSANEGVDEPAGTIEPAENAPSQSKAA